VEGGGGSLPCPGRPPAGVMGVRGKRGRFPQAGRAGGRPLKRLASELVRARADQEGDPASARQDRASPLRYKARSLPEMAKAQGYIDLAVTLSLLLLQKRDVAAASWPQYGRKSERRLPPAAGGRGCGRTTGSFCALDATAKWRSAPTATAASRTAARLALSRLVGSCREPRASAIKPPRRGVATTRLGRRDTARRDSSSANLRKK